MEIIAYRGRPFSDLVHEFVSHFAPLQLYSSHIALSVSKHRVDSNDGSHLESLDARGPGRRILQKVCTHSLTVKR